MKRIIYLLSVIFISSNLFTQNIIFKNIGAPISKKDSIKIIDMIYAEMNFYNKIYSIDSAYIKLNIYDDKSAYEEVRSKYRMKGVAGGGFFRSEDTTCYVLRNKNRERGYLPIVYHEMSHYFTRRIINKTPPIWLTEGLSEYFEYSEMKKKRLTHYLSEYVKGRIKTMIEIKEIDLKKHIALSYHDFMKRQITDENYSYTLSHGIVYFLIEKDFEQFKTIVLKIKDGSSSYDAIQETYSGGFVQFERDFIAYYSKKS